VVRVRESQRDKVASNKAPAWQDSRKRKEARHASMVMMGAEEKHKFLEQQRSIVKVSRQFLAKWDKSGASPDMKQDRLEARQHQPSESPKHLRIRPFYDQHGISYLVELT